MIDWGVIGLLMDKLLHHGKHQVTSDHSSQDQSVRGWQALFGRNKNFNRKDRFIYVAIGSWSILWALLFFAVLVVSFFIKIPDSFWLQFLHFYVWMAVVLGIVTTFWFLCGGVIDMRKMFHRLQTMVRDETDNGE